MSGGFEELVVNPNERAVSIDMMRLQRFKGADLAELWRSMVNTSFGTDDLDADGLSTQVTTQNTPISGEVYGGLVVQPTVGALDLLIAPGSAFVLDPDSPQNPDESLYKFVRDPGIISTGVLQMTANSSGSTRIDVIECARVANGYNVLETDNRDIFSTVTGLFTATTVNKVTAGAFQYRVRAGTPGGGYPAAVAGWMPLAVASVPTGTTTNDTITFWDVRPLVADRIKQPFAVSRDLSLIEQTYATLDVNTYSGKAVLTGWVAGNSCDQLPATPVPGRHRLGGRLRRGTPGLDLPNAGSFPDGIDLNDAANQSSTWVTNQNVYVYLLEPFNLPRWARYTDAVFGARKPRGPRGMVVASPIAPKQFYGSPGGLVALPSSTGLGGSTSKGVCILVTTGGSASQTVNAAAADGRTVWSSPGFPFGSLQTATSAAGSPLVVSFASVHAIVPHAKALYVSIFIPLSLADSNVGAVSSATVDVQNTAGALVRAATLPNDLVVPNNSGGTITVNWSKVLRIPIPPTYATPAPNLSLVVTLGLNNYALSGSFTACHFEVLGFDV